MKLRKKVAYNVECTYNEEHVFKKVFLIEGDTDNEETEVQAFCPFCDKHVTVTVQGKVVADKELLRRFGIE